MLLTRHRGFTLVELLISIAIVAFLAVLATPGITTFLVNSRIRNAADGIGNGVRQARMEAVKRNRSIDFVLTAGGYTIVDQGPPVTTLDTVTLFDAQGVTATAAPGGSTAVRYTALGQYDNASLAGPIRRVVVTSSTVATPRTLHVVVDPALGVGIKVCDPAFTIADPVGCP